jgi:hypothetical protein
MKAIANNLSITRLFSTGRFEHQKISVSISPGHGAKAGSLLRELDSILSDLNPVCPVDEYVLNQARELIAAGDEERLEILKKRLFVNVDASDLIARAEVVLGEYRAWLERRESAYARLDAMGVMVEEESKEG